MTAHVDVAAYVAERNAALATLDLAWALKQAPRLSPEIALMGMHKARYECTHIAPGLRQESRRWLEERKLGRLSGLPFPDSDELPA